MGRGESFYFSKDIEDIIVLLDGCAALPEEFEKAEGEVKIFLQQWFGENRANLEDAVANFLPCFSSKFLATLKFKVRGNDSGLLTALDLVHEIHLGRRRKLPDDAPTEFISEPWQPYVQSGQKIDRRYYELAALWLLRQKLRSGDIYLAQSRRFSELETYFIPPKEWSLCRDEVVNLTGTPIDARLRLAERESELITLMGQVEELLNQPDSDLREERGSLVLSPFKADEKTLELKRLAEEITVRLPRIEITDLLVEVDSWTDFSNAFEHLNQGQNQNSNSLLSLYSCLLAQACNLDFQQMATSTGLLYRRLCWFNNWYIRDETLRLANNILIDYHYDLPLSHLWGGGMLSSSDGQRFPAKGSLRQARSLPRYFGYGKGVTFYSWTRRSDSNGTENNALSYNYDYLTQFPDGLRRGRNCVLFDSVSISN